jgi:hypothetical protein
MFYYHTNSYNVAVMLHKEPSIEPIVIIKMIIKAPKCGLSNHWQTSILVSFLSEILFAMIFGLPDSNLLSGLVHSSQQIVISLCANNSDSTFVNILAIFLISEYTELPKYNFCRNMHKNF